MSLIRMFRLLKSANLIKTNVDLRCSKVKLSTAQQSKETHFGFERVSEKEKAEKVHAVFENVSSNYDLMNDINSLGIHRLWKDYFVTKLAPSPGTQLLDVAGGTGDISFRFLNYVSNLNEVDDLSYIKKRNPMNLDLEEDSTSVSSSSSDEKNTQDSTHAVVCDINEAMLNVGKQKSKILGFDESQLSWVQGDAEKLPFDDNSFDVYTIAFGIRNCVHMDKVICEAHRVLKRGGRFMCLEFSHVDNSLLRSFYLSKTVVERALVNWIIDFLPSVQAEGFLNLFPIHDGFYDLYSFEVIPVVGEIVAKDWKSYQYLVESIRQFPKQKEFQRLIRSCGFKHVTYENLSFGISAIHSGFKM